VVAWLLSLTWQQSIAKTANSGSEAFSNGQTTSAASIVDQLTKNVLLVAQMVATMNLRDQNAGSPLGSGSPHAQTAAASTASHTSPPASIGLDSSQAQHINGLPGFDSPTASLEPSSSLDAPDMSRKRCASTLDGDRVVKAMKMEPQDDVSLQMPPPAHMNTSTSFSFSAPTTISPAMATIAEHPTIPSVPSLPGTRPPSSSGRGMTLMQDMQATHSTMHFPSHIDFAPQLPHPPTDFSALPSGPATAPTPLATTAFPSSSSLTNSWPESRPGVSRHSHSLSGAGSSISGLQHSVHPLSVATNLAYTPSSSAFHSPTHPTIPSQAPIAPAVGRMSRSSSFSQPNPFAFGVDTATALPYDHMQSSMQSRPSTSGGAFTRATSPEYDDDDDGDESDDGLPSTARNVYHPHTPPSGTSDGKASPPGTSARRGSRTSPSAEGTTGAHGNEVPQEYKAEVERIFFEFLSKTCSNCTCLSCSIAFSV
jgi:hypothetical protein